MYQIIDDTNLFEDTDHINKISVTVKTGKQGWMNLNFGQLVVLFIEQICRGRLIWSLGATVLVTGLKYLTHHAGSVGFLLVRQHHLAASLSGTWCPFTEA